MRKRRIKGDRAFKKILKRLPASMKKEMEDALDEAGDLLLGEMQSAVPSETGRLRRALKKKLARGSMKLRVGLVGKPANRHYFYGRIVEFGRRAQTVNVVRGTTRSKAASAKSRRSQGLSVRKPYLMNVRGMRARPFVYTKRLEQRAAIRTALGKYWNQVLLKAASGVTDD